MFNQSLLSLLLFLAVAPAFATAQGATNQLLSFQCMATNANGLSAKMVIRPSDDRAGSPAYQLETEKSELVNFGSNAFLAGYRLQVATEQGIFQSQFSSYLMIDNPIGVDTKTVTVNLQSGEGQIENQYKKHPLASKEIYFQLKLSGCKVSE